MIEPIVVGDLKALRKVVLASISEYGPSVDLSHVDVGGVDTFDGLFKDTGFCGDVSGWNMGKAKSANEMFAGTPFNGDVSKWNLKHLEEARSMFKDSQFNGDVSQWNVGTMLRCDKNEGLFEGTLFSQDLSAWHIGNVREKFFVNLFSVITKNDLLWSAVSGGNKPTPKAPTSTELRDKSLVVYAKLFSGQDQLGEYFARAPFGVMHFDACCVSEMCPVGITPQDFEWSRELLTLGTGLGLDNAGLREFCASQLGMRNQKTTESFSLDGFLGNELDQDLVK